MTEPWNLPIGPELDHLIAEHVMHYRIIDEGTDIGPIGAAIYGDVTELMPLDGPVTLYRGHVYRYSRDVFEAESILRIVTMRGIDAQINRAAGTDTWTVTLTKGGDEWTETRESLPHAICLATIAAVGIPEKTP